MASKSKSPATMEKGKSRMLAFPVEFQLRIIKLYQKEGYSPRCWLSSSGLAPIRFSAV